VEGRSDVASVYHLIDRGGAAAYQRAVEGIRLDGLRVAISGPWPAWSFAPEIEP
ncbi:MAG: gas vesicle protein GvpFL, partial [Deltaproteobacteria bacterium]